MDNSKLLFDTPVVLENQRVRLSPLQAGDLDSLLPVANDASIWKWGLGSLETPGALKLYIETAIHERNNQVSYPFVIFDKDVDRVAGSTRYGNISLEHKRLEIGWTWLHPDFQATGLNRHCKFLLLQFAFETLGLNRVEFKTDARNKQSRTAIARIGATQEGIFRKHLVTPGGRIRDSVYFSIIDNEWPRIRRTVFKDF